MSFSSAVEMSSRCSCLNMRSMAPLSMKSRRRVRDDGRCFGRYEIAESAFVVYHAERGEVFVGAHYRVDIYHHGGCIVAYGRDSFVGRQHALQHAVGYVVGNL